MKVNKDDFASEDEIEEETHEIKLNDSKRTDLL
jgi:hypothetical protein